MIKNINLLDCTLRDGGYYNNWDFKFSQIQDYLNSIASTEIKFVELGFRFLEKNRIKGLTAYTDNKLLKNLKVSKKIKIGVMINTGDLLKNNLSPLENCKKIFERKSDHLHFVRLACHYEEIFKITEAINWLKKNKLTVFVNLMQISEIEKKKIVKVCNYLNNTKTDIFYFADSLGSLTPLQTKKITKIIKKNYKNQFGIHAHDNLSYALRNSVIAYRNGANWIDSTITGMGRGPGNLKTEDILNHFKNQKKNRVKKKTLNFFNNLKRFYKWGTNKYYVFAARNKIHPTYIQKLLSDDRYKKQDYMQILDHLKKIDTRKYNPYKLINSSFFLSQKPNGKDEPKKILKNKNFLILGPGKSLFLNKAKIEKFVKVNQPFVICLNTVKLLNESLINLRVACHPMRIISDIKFYNMTKTRIGLPYTMMTKKIKNLIKLKKSQILDYGLKINYNSDIKITKTHCTLPSPLALGYCLSMIISSGIKNKNLYFAGFDGYNKSNSNMDESEEIIKLLKKKMLNKSLKSLTPTKYSSFLTI